MPRWIPPALLVCLLVSCDTADDDPSPLSGCEVGGVSGLSYSLDDGRTVAPNVSIIASTRVNGLAESDAGRLFAATNEFLYTSERGCEWAGAGRLPGGMRLTAVGTDAYAWGVGQRAVFVSGGPTSLRRRGLPSSIEQVRGLGGTGRDVRVVSPEGQLFVSSDRGETWRPSGTPPPGQSAFRFTLGGAFAPLDHNHGVVWQQDGTTGASLLWQTEDGGRSWEPGTIAADRVRDAAFAPSDLTVVWALAEVGERNAFFASTDGGRTFEEVFREPEDPAVVVTSLAPFAVDPRDPNVLYWSASVDGAAVLYRYDRASDALTFETQPGMEGYSAFVLSTETPGMVALGFGLVRDK